MPQMRIMKSHYQQKTGPYLWLISIRARISCNFSYGNILCSCTFFLSSTKPDVRNCSTILYITLLHRQSQWPRGLRRGSDAARLLRLWVRIPPGTLMFVCCECCVLSGRGLCDELITRPEKSWLWYVVVGDLEISWMRSPGPLGAVAQKANRQTLLHQIVHQGH